MMKVAIEKIMILERIRKEITKIDELAADISKNGLINAVTVMPIGGGEFRLLAGLRRIKAVESLGWTEIEVNAVSPSDAEAALLIEISENEQREPFTFTEQMDLARLLEEIETAKAKERMYEGGKEAGRGRPSATEKGVSNWSHPNHGRRRHIVGTKIGLSGTQYERAKYIVKKATPEIIDQLDRKERSIGGTYDELREREKATTQCNPVSVAPESPTKHKTASHSTNVKKSHLKPLSAQDEEAIRKLREYDALPPEGKIAELQRQLREERARAAGAESELARLKELRQNDVYHKDSIIESLKRQNSELSAALDATQARIQELEAQYEQPHISS